MMREDDADNSFTTRRSVAIPQGPSRVVSGAHERMPPSRTHRLLCPIEPTSQQCKIDYRPRRKVGNCAFEV